MHSCLFEIRHIAEVKWVTNAVSCWLWHRAQLFWPMFNVLDQTCYIDSRIYSCTACHDQSTVQMCHAISSDPNKRYFLCVVISIIFSHESRNAGSLLQDTEFLKLVRLDSTFEKSSVSRLIFRGQSGSWVLYRSNKVRHLILRQKLAIFWSPYG